MEGWDPTDAKIDLSVHISVSDMSERIKQLKGKDRTAVCSEFLEWLVLDEDDLEVEWFPHHSGW